MTITFIDKNDFLVTAFCFNFDSNYLLFFAERYVA